MFCKQYLFDFSANFISMIAPLLNFGIPCDFLRLLVICCGSLVCVVLFRRCPRGTDFHPFSIIKNNQHQNIKVRNFSTLNINSLTLNRSIKFSTSVSDFLSLFAIIRLLFI